MEQEVFTNQHFCLKPNKRIYAIGDIHGYVDVLKDLHQKIDDDLTKRPIDNAYIIYLGDYIDRGPDSKGVIDLLLKRKDTVKNLRHIFLMGNHEDAMLEFMQDPHGPRQDWVVWGGVEAMESYGMTINRDFKLTEIAADLAQELSTILPDTHHQFYKTLGAYHIEDGYLFAHAGMRPNINITEQTKRDLIFTRSPFLDHEDLHTHYIVHGHTIANNKRADIKTNRMNLDSGLYEGGPLSCSVIESNTINIIEAWNV